MKTRISCQPRKRKCTQKKKKMNKRAKYTEEKNCFEDILIEFCFFIFSQLTTSRNLIWRREKKKKRDR
jgi:hypothetical protein